MQGLFDDEQRDAGGDEWPDKKKAPDEPFVLSNYTPGSENETARQSGLAWSAGIAFFVSIVFMLFLGWFADLLFGSSPWGLVGGIVLGAMIGFFQLFRTTSQIFKNNDSGPSEHPLMSPAERPQPDRTKPSGRDESLF